MFHSLCLLPDFQRSYSQQPFTFLHCYRFFGDCRKRSHRLRGRVRSGRRLHFTSHGYSLHSCTGRQELWRLRIYSVQYIRNRPSTGTSSRMMLRREETLLRMVEQLKDAGRGFLRAFAATGWRISQTPHRRRDFSFHTRVVCSFTT